MHIAIIPARGGSKRIPRKNIRPFHGKPIIAYSIETAMNSGLFDHVVVSTDDAEIAEVAEGFGASVPFMRPAELADDHTGTTAVLRHSLQWVTDNWGEVQSVCSIYPTAPFVRVSDLMKGKSALEQFPAAFSVTTFPYPIFRALQRSAEGRVSMVWPEHVMTRSQDLPEGWHDAAQFYWAQGDYILGGGDFMSGDAFGVEIPRMRVQDIDTEEDWEQAEALFRIIGNQ